MGRRAPATDWRLEMAEHEIAVSASADTPGDPRVRVLRATLRDRSGDGIRGVTVRFALEGPGSLGAHGAARTASDVTDTDGFAWTRWVAPPADGSGEIEARVTATADVEEADIVLDHFHHATDVGPYAPAAP